MGKTTASSKSLFASDKSAMSSQWILGSFCIISRSGNENTIYSFRFLFLLVSSDLFLETLKKFLPSISTRSLSYPPESNRRSSFSSSTIFSSLVSSCLAVSLLVVADLLDVFVDDLSSLLPALLNLESGLLAAAVPEPEGGFPPRPGVGFTGPSDFFTGRERTGAGALKKVKFGC